MREAGCETKSGHATQQCDLQNERPSGYEKDLGRSVTSELFHSMMTVCPQNKNKKKKHIIAIVEKKNKFGH